MTRNQPDGHRRRKRRGALDFHGVPDSERLVARRITRLTRPNRLAGRDKLATVAGSATADVELRLQKETSSFPLPKKD